jgi:hypothetical protein
MDCGGFHYRLNSISGRNGIDRWVLRALLGKDLEVNLPWMTKAKKISGALAVAGAIGAGVVMLIQPQPAPYSLIWDYQPQTNVVFNVFHSTNGIALANFVPWTNVPTPPVRFWPTQQQEFFIVRASNTVSHQVSDWARK